MASPEQEHSRQWPNFRDDRGRWDQGAEHRYIFATAIAEAAMDVGVPQELIEPFLEKFALHLDELRQEAGARPTGPDGLPV